MDKGDEEKDGIGADRHNEDFVSAVELIKLYADKYHDKDAEYAKEHIEALDDIIKDEDYHIQRALDLDRQRIDTEDMIISIAERIKGRYDDTTKESKSPDKDGIDYYFVSREEFLKRASEGKFLEHAEFVGNYYGTPLDKVNERLEDGQEVVLER